MKFKLKKICSEGEMYPKFYGFAYYSYVSREVVCYPIPINIIVSFFRNVWWEILNPKDKKVEQIKKISSELYDQGYKDGYKSGYYIGYKTSQDEYVKKVDEYFKLEK